MRTVLTASVSTPTATRSGTRSRTQQEAGGGEEDGLEDEHPKTLLHLTHHDEGKGGQEKGPAGQIVQRSHQGSHRHRSPPQKSRVIMAATAVTKAAPRNSLIRYSLSFATDDSMIPSTARKTATFRPTRGMAARISPSPGPRASPHGVTSTFT